jgi:EmrB/QacA subfamily drug resistance transporter
VASVTLTGGAARVRGRLAGLPYHWQALAIVVLGSFMALLNMTIVQVALPRIIQVFGATVDQGQLVITAYILAMAIVMPATGYAADTFGTKRTYLTTIALFTIATALCGFAPSIEGLIAFRVVQGLSGGMIMTLGMSIIFQVSPPRQRGSIMGFFGLPVLVAPMVGPIVGGYVVEYVDWRLVFALGIPVGVLAVTLGATVLRETARRGGTRFDWAGFVLAAIGFSAALLALSRAPNDGWTAPHVVALGLVAAAALPSFVVVELTREHPLLDLTVLRDPTYVCATLVTMVFMLVMLASSFLLPLFLQNVRGLGPLETGLLLAPEAVASAVMMPIAGRLVDRIGPRLLMVPGLLLLVYAYWLLSSLDLNTSDDTLRLVLVLRGVAMGAVMMPAITVAMDRVPPARMARATALANVLRQLAGTFGTAAFASLLLSREQFHRSSLAQTVTPDSIATVQALAAAQAALVGQGVSEAAAQTAGLAQLARQVELAAKVRGFDDCFLVAALLSVVALLPVLLLRRGRAQRAGHSEG